MYKTADYEYQQLSFIKFNASCGMQLDCENEWFKRASQLPRKAWYKCSSRPASRAVIFGQLLDG